jgi:hypothetical protein
MNTRHHLVGYVNRKTDEIRFFRKAIHLIVLWFAR